MGATLISSNKVTMDVLSDIKVPDQTNSYVPVSHIDFINNTKNIADRILNKHQLHSEQYGIARDGKQMFGTLTYKESFNDGEEQDIGLSIGLRNSYDKSMSLGLCSGGSVFVCENLMMTGEVVVMRMHKGNIIDELKGLIFKALLDAEDKFETIHADSQLMRDVVINNAGAYAAMGKLYGYGVISERQLPVMKREWLKPTHDTFEDRTIWSLYNAGTEALKTTPPMHRMKRQIEMHKLFTVNDQNEVAFVHRLN